jgi:hypothetical protein
MVENLANCVKKQQIQLKLHLETNLSKKIVLRELLSYKKFPKKNY